MYTAYCISSYLCNLWSREWEVSENLDGAHHAWNNSPRGQLRLYFWLVIYLRHIIFNVAWGSYVLTQWHGETKLQRDRCASVQIWHSNAPLAFSNDLVPRRNAWVRVQQWAINFQSARRSEWAKQLHWVQLQFAVNRALSVSLNVCRMIHYFGVTVSFLPGLKPTTWSKYKYEFSSPILPYLLHSAVSR